MIDTSPSVTARDLARPLALLLPQDIRDLRRLCALSMRELARRLDVNVATVSEWEAGSKMPTRQHVYELLDVFMAAMQDAGALRSRARRLRQRAMVDVGEGARGASDGATPAAYAC
jgi:DNA-binding transcriptional regulator YiaG